MKTAIARIGCYTALMAVLLTLCEVIPRLRGAARGNQTRPRSASSALVVKALLAAVLALLFVGCGSSDSESTPPNSAVDLVTAYINATLNRDAETLCQLESGGTDLEIPSCSGDIDWETDRLTTRIDSTAAAVEVVDANSGHVCSSETSRPHFAITTVEVELKSGRVLCLNVTEDGAVAVANTNADTKPPEGVPSSIPDPGGVNEAERLALEYAEVVRTADAKRICRDYPPPTVGSPDVSVPEAQLEAHCIDSWEYDISNASSERLTVEEITSIQSVSVEGDDYCSTYAPDPPESSSAMIQVESNDDRYLCVLMYREDGDPWQILGPINP